MWEHAGPLVGVPGAIKALWDILDRISSVLGTAADPAKEGQTHLTAMRGALESFAQDALELAAYKKLHNLTNSLFIDLKETFVINTPDTERSMAHHHQNLRTIQDEYQRLWAGQRTGDQLAGLQESPQLMRYLTNMPSEVSECLPKNVSWDAHYRTLLRRSREECENYKNFRTLVSNLYGLNNVLNNYADRNIARGIDKFDSIMSELRSALTQS